MKRTAVINAVRFSIESDTGVIIEQIIIETFIKKYGILHHIVVK